MEKNRAWRTKKKHNNITSDDGCPPELVKRFMRADVGGKSSFCLLFPSLPPILGGRGGLYVKLRFRGSLCLIIYV